MIDLHTNEVLAERIGYMMDVGQGSQAGGRSPWLLAANNSCPQFLGQPASTDQIGQAEKFVEKILKPKLIKSETMNAVNSLLVSDCLKYANLQMAAEAFLKNDVTGIKNYSGDALSTALKDGNQRASRFTGTQAKEFEAQWTVVDQRANTSTGFSGTLFRNRETNEYVISFRSTEFIDDSARDNAATNTLEIKEFGYAFGQISDMEAWYEELKRSKKLPEGESPSPATAWAGTWPRPSTSCMRPKGASRRS